MEWLVIIDGELGPEIEEYERYKDAFESREYWVNEGRTAIIVEADQLKDILCP